jgi:hypothetical protein
MNYTYIALSLYTFSSIFILAHAQPIDIGDGLRNNTASKALKNKANQYSRWSGIGLLTTPEGTCTSTLIDTRDTSVKTPTPAYLITSGHCVTHEIGIAKLNQVFDAKVTFNYFHDAEESHKTYKIKTANWTSMVGTDLAIIELEQPLSTLIQNGISPLKLALATPLGSQDVLNVGAPGKFSEKGLRLSACTQEVSRTLSGTPPAFPGGMISQCKGMTDGSSGSPMLDRRTNQIVSIVSENNYSYSPNFLSGCFIKGIFTNNHKNCALQPVDIAVEFQSLFRTNVRSEWNAAHQEILPTWNYRFTIDTPYYRFKTTRDASNCHTPNHYTPSFNSTNASINTFIGPATGIHVLCIIGVNSTQQELTSALLKNAFTHAVHLAEPAPSPLLTPQKEQTLSMTWDNAYPEYTSHFFYAGPAETTHCGDYRDARYKKAAAVETLHLASPIKICSYASNDSDLQPSATRVDIVAPPVSWAP